MKSKAKHNKSSWASTPANAVSPANVSQRGTESEPVAQKPVSRELPTGTDGKLTITLHSDMCPGNGESMGNRVDTDIWTDDAGLPVITARRVKGCLRQSAELLKEYQYVLPGCRQTVDQDMIDRVFGTPQRPAAFVINDAVLPGYRSMRAELREHRDPTVTSPVRVTELFTHIAGQTMLDNGVAKENTLRYTRLLNQWSPLRENT